MLNSSSNLKKSLRFLSTLKREEFLTQILENKTSVEKIYGSETLTEIANAVNDVGRWFP